jgi:alcohol dehydrogenase class IV
MVCRLAVHKSPARDAVLRKIFGQDLQQAPEQLAAFLHGLGVKTGFADYGVSEDEAQRMVAHAMQGVRGKNFIGAVA